MSVKKLTTTRGEEYAIRPVSDTLIAMALKGIEKEYRKRSEPLDRPRYRVEIAGGGEQWFDHDEKTLQSDDDRAAWDAWKDAVARLEAEQEAKRLRILLKGVVFTPASGWEQLHQAVGVEVPEDPEEKWYHYLTTEVLVTPDDLFNAIELVTKATYQGGVDETAIEAAMDNFRCALRQNSTQAFAGGARSVEPQPPDGGSVGSEGLGQNAE